MQGEPGNEATEITCDRKMELISSPKKFKIDLSITNHAQLFHGAKPRGSYSCYEQVCM